MEFCLLVHCSSWLVYDWLTDFHVVSILILMFYCPIFMSEIIFCIISLLFFYICSVCVAVQTAAVLYRDILPYLLFLPKLETSVFQYPILFCVNRQYTGTTEGCLIISQHFFFCRLLHGCNLTISSWYFKAKKSFFIHTSTVPT